MLEFTEEPKIYNSKVKFSYLGFDENKGGTTIWWQLGFDYECGTAITPKICLNSPDGISNILNVLDLHNWEEVPRKFARIKIVGKQVIAIGNLIENKWLMIA